MIISAVLLLFYVCGRIVRRDIILFVNLHHSSLRLFRITVGRAAFAALLLCCQSGSGRFNFNVFSIIFQEGAGNYFLRLANWGLEN